MILKKNRSFLIILVLITIVGISLNIKKYVIDQDFTMYMHTPCNTGESCFIVYDGQDDEIFNDEPYTKMYRNHINIKHCYETGECDVFVCDSDEAGCEKIFCSEDTLEEGEECINQ